MNILLVCSAGMSTSLLVTKMKEESDRRNLTDMNIFACSMDELEQYLDGYDVLLIGPQLRYKEKSLKALAESKNVPCAVIDAISYGRVDGKSVLDQAINLANS